ncbi:hypothetical protein [Mesorhizobium sp. M9A.F.Ca.ET.002.03.1.2]|uniref:hypothetical protein n=1 Tax=Mesorhizobium sp. M9A.F.Ca.ET.002.03.1.2 TaxID=2493668 RepID=UPI001FE198B7|nr:hypothetical protein [Mesorhizobium sp. M9A.F.Ca.ET.002.03.1.2]
MQRRLSTPAIVAAARGLAINGDLTDRFGQTLADEGQKAGGEQVRPDPVHHHPQPIRAGNAEMVGLQTPQEVEMPVPPQNDVVIVVAGLPCGR